MKKLKHIAIATMMIIIIISILLGKSIISSASPDGTWQPSKATVTLGQYIQCGGSPWMTSYWNSYCLEKGQALRDNMTYFVEQKVEIRGYTATFYDYKGNVKGTVAMKYNNVMGAILTPNEYIPGGSRPWWSIGMYADINKAQWPQKNFLDYSRAQVSLYKYLPKWESKLRANGYTLGWGYNSGGAENLSWYDGCDDETDWVDGQFWRCEDLAEQFTFNIDLYYMTSNYQNLLVVDPYPATPGTPTLTTSVSVKKVWNDNNNTYGTRPNSITVQLKANGVVKQTQTLDSSNNWSYTFTQLPTGVTYSISEVSAPTGYTTKISGSESSGFIITNTLQTTSVKVTKKWDDDSNRDGIRPKSITVTLYENGVATNTKATLSASNNWTYTFKDLPKYKNGSEVKYTINEDGANKSTVSKYATNNNVAKITGDASSGYTITNKHVPARINVTVKKEWNDEDDLDELRKPITVTLYKNGTSTGQTITLNESNNWTGSFKNLYKYESGKLINYTVKENAISGYTVEGDQSKDKVQDTDGNITYRLKNTHTPHYDGYIEISGKAWLDGQVGKQNDIDGEYIDKKDDEDSTDKPLQNIKVTLKDAKGNVIKSTYTDENGQFTRNDFGYTDGNGDYIIRVNYDNSQNVYKLYEDVATVNKKLETAYVEFEYDGMKYTTVKAETTGANKSKATENETARNTLDNNHSKVMPSTEHPDNWTDKNITAVTNKITSYESNNENKDVVVKYCNGNGTYIRTNPDGAWKDILAGTKNLACNSGEGHNLATYDITVQKIPNINLGLFEREQPDVAIFSDLTKVEVVMNKQKYTYLYGVRNSELKAEGNLQAQFQNKNTYTYRRPVNPADIAYIQEPSNSNNMSVKVTYEVKVANLSSTLVTTINSISNYFDSRYTLTNTSEWSITQENGFNKATPKRDLNITLQPETESSPIELTYEVSLEAIRDLLNKEATLNNAVEIESYSTAYGENTVYAEQRTGGRTNKPYAGYDYNSHPGNANIKLMDSVDGVERLYSTDSNGNIIPASKLQDDTDIAPSFVLCLDVPKAIEGIVWEDSDTNENDDERLGDGKRDDNENKVKNVKIEMYEVNSDGTIADTPVKLYNKDTKHLDRETVIYTEDDGKYNIEGIVTGKEYLIKYTYGNDSEELDGNTTTISGNDVNARNYKSTIITNADEKIYSILETKYSALTPENKMWPLTHKDKYSVAVDNMEDRLSIEELKNSTYGNGENMTAYTKPFIIPLEFDSTLGTSGNSNIDGDVNDSTGGKVESVLNKFDFGIIERPREQLIVQKTIKYFKITLANGQLLTEGNPNDPNSNMDYVKAIGFKERTSVKEAMNAVEKRLLAEIDSELTQGAQLEAIYDVKVTNNNEIDYDYGELTDYENDYIARGNNASYYYYGVRSSNQKVIKSTIKFVDYLDSNLVYKEDTSKWKQSNASELKEEGFIDNNVMNELNKGKYKILQIPSEDIGGSSITLGRTETFSQEMTTSKLLSIRDDNTFYNHAEIIEIDGKTGRTIKGKDEQGKQIEYIPGNYQPVTGENNETDNDSVNITITPPTGITNYVTTYIIAGLAGLITIVAGIIFIKKKILIK